jgi:hypothetical protein
MLRDLFYLQRKGSMPLKTAARIVLGIMVVAVVYASASGWITDIGEKFVSGLVFPTS